jgi:hypothetical protein
MSLSPLFNSIVTDASAQWFLPWLSFETDIFDERWGMRANEFNPVTFFLLTLMSSALGPTDWGRHHATVRFYPSLFCYACLR